MHWDKVTIVGVGLLGGSIGLAMKHRKIARKVYGVVRRKSAVVECGRLGVVDAAGLDLLGGVEGADLVIMCTPIADIARLALRLRPALKRGAILTDVGSVKGPIVRKLGSLIRRAGGHFVGSHPMAGSDQGGVLAARRDLFKDAVTVVTPDDLTHKAAVHKLTSLWKALGSRVLTMKASLHDQLVSRASHLPHMVAAVLANQVLDPREDQRQARLCASGFRDTTRIAAGSAVIWQDIAMANRANLVQDLERFESNLAALRESLMRDDSAAVSKFLSSAQSRRQSWGASRPSTGEE